MPLDDAALFSLPATVGGDWTEDDKMQQVAQEVASSATATGHVRHRNEDSHYMTSGLWAVSDGMGGHAGGQMASWLATLSLAQWRDEKGDLDAKRLAAGVQFAHRMVVAGGAHRETPEMGATLVAATLQADGQLAVAWVGDSRAYLLHEGRLERLTEDHNEAAELVRAGKLSCTDAAAHPGRHYLTRALGCGRRTSLRVETRIVPSRGRLLLCTDGLHGELDDDQIAGLLAPGTSQQAAQRLLDAALTAGGHDNITVVVVDLPPEAPEPVEATDPTAAAAGRATTSDWQSAVVRAYTEAGPAKPALQTLVEQARKGAPHVTRKDVRGVLESAGLLPPVLPAPPRATAAGKRRPRRAARTCGACGVAYGLSGRCRCSA